MIATLENGIRSFKEATEGKEKACAPLPPALEMDGQAAEQGSAWQSACRPRRQLSAAKCRLPGTPLLGSLSVPLQGHRGRWKRRAGLPLGLCCLLQARDPILEGRNRVVQQSCICWCSRGRAHTRQGDAELASLLQRRSGAHAGVTWPSGVVSPAAHPACGARARTGHGGDHQAPAQGRPAGRHVPRGAGAHAGCGPQPCPQPHRVRLRAPASALLKDADLLWADLRAYNTPASRGRTGLEIWGRGRPGVRMKACCPAKVHTRLGQLRKRTACTRETLPGSSPS